MADENPAPSEAGPVDPVKAARVEGLTKLLMFAFATANEQPYVMAVPAVRRVAEMLDALNVQQVEGATPEVELPGWVMERVREDAAPTPVEPDHFAVQETDRVAEAPSPPSRIAKKWMGVAVEDESFGGAPSA